MTDHENDHDGYLAQRREQAPARTRRRNRPSLRRMQPATGPQLYTLNEQGLLQLAPITDELFTLGGPAEGWTSITMGEAFPLVARLKNERWAGLGRCPRAGEAWRVDEASGVVVPVGRHLELPDAEDLRS